MTTVIDVIQIILLLVFAVGFIVGAIVCTIHRLDPPGWAHFSVMFSGVVGTINVLLMYDRFEWRD